MILKLILYAFVSYFYLFVLLSNHSIILAKRSSKIVPFFALTKEDIKPINMTFNDTDSDDDDDDDNDNKDDKDDQIYEKKTTELPKIDRSKVVEGKDAYPSYKKMGYGAWVANNVEKLNALITRHRRHWVYFYKPNQVILENVNKPDYYAKTYETFPARLTSILATNNASDYYFFNRKKYCRRPYDLRDNSQGSCPNGWKPNYDLFGCSKADTNPKLKALCKNPDIDGSFILKEITYITRKSKYWMFSHKSSESNHFKEFKDGDKDADKTWPGYQEESDGVFVYTSKLTQVYNGRWYQWSEKGDRTPYFPIREKPVKKLSIPKTFDRYVSVITITEEKIVTIMSTTVYYFSVKNSKATIINKPVKYIDSPEHLPPNITGSVKSPDNQWYFFRDDQYCKRPFDASGDKSFKPPDFCNWGQNKDLFKCDKYKNIPAMDTFCTEPFVDGAVILRKEYLIFRSGRYWQYDGEPTSDTGPFGKLIDGALYSSDRFKDFDQNPGMFALKDKLILFKRRKAYQTLTNSKADSTTTINEAEQVDSKINIYGTPVVYTEETEIKIALVMTSSAYYYKYVGNKMYKMNGGKPEPLSNSKYKFPTKLNAALYEPKSKVYYFIRLNKFCKRTLNPLDAQTENFVKNYATAEVEENGDKLLVKGKPKAEEQEKDTLCNWFNIGHLFGCNNQRKSSALIDLCNNPIPSGAALLDKKIYIFRETSYYVFNGRSSEYSVFGKLIEGPTEAAQKFKAFDPSNGGVFSYEEQLYSIFERVQWSRWFADGKRDLYDQTILSEGSTPPPDKAPKQTSTEKPSTAAISAENPSKKPSREEQTTEKPTTNDVNRSKDMTSNQHKGHWTMVHISGIEYALIKETTVRYYKKRNNNWYPDGDEMDVDKSRHRFPAGVTAVHGKNRDNTYIFFKGNQHCKRKLFVISSFICEFRDNREILGCSDDNLDGHRLLCINPFITSAALIGNKNFLFREDKYWIFDPSKSGKGFFGYFESGPNPIENYPKMTTLSDVIFGAIDRLTMFTKKSFYSWLPDGKPDVVDAPLITDHEIYPSMRDENKLGTMVQINAIDYVRIRGKFVFYYEKKAGQTYTQKQQSKQYVSTRETNEKFEDEMTAITKLNDDQYLFFKKGFVCKRSLTAKEYCDWISTGNIFNCHDSQTPEMSELCNDPVIDAALLTDTKNTLFLIKNNNLYSTVWEDIISKLSLTTTKFLTKFVKNVDRVLNGYHPNPDAIFRVDYGPERGNYVMFHNNRYTMWCPCKNQNLVVSQNVTINETPYVEPIDNSVEQRKDDNAKEEITTTENDAIDDPSNANKTLIYTQQEFIDFCKDPIFSAADSAINGSQVYLFTKDRYYILEDLRFGVGKLVSFGSTRDWLKDFDVGDSNSVTTIKEGWERGYMYEFMPKSMYVSWKPSPYFKLDHKKASYYALPKEGFWASLHNRDLNKPMLIGLEGENVHYFSTKNRVFSRVGPTLRYNKSPEKFPPNITAAFSMPNGYIYLFRNKKHCIREWTYSGSGSYCPHWNDNRQFLGCYGQESPPFSLERSIASPIDRLVDESSENSDVNYKNLLCENLDIADGDALVDGGNSIVVWRGDKYWRIDEFPENPTVSFSGQTSVNWPEFLSNPDAVTFVHESSDRRGYLYAFHGPNWSTWRPDLKMMTVKKAWGQPEPSNKFGAVLHTRDVNSQMAIGFDGKWVHYYSTEMSNFVFKKKVTCDNSEEKWPTNVTAAWRVNDDFYLFRGDKYCVRKWLCNEPETSCCNAWLEARDLFNCEEIKETNKDKELKDTQENAQLDISRLRTLLPVSGNEDEEDVYVKLYQLLNEVYYIYEIIDTKAQLIQGPIPAKYSSESLPSAVTAAVRFNGSYLFFKADKYCRRALELPKLYSKPNKVIIIEKKCPSGYRESSLLFECEKAATDAHKELCKDLAIDGALIIENQFIVLRKSLYWIFNVSDSGRLAYETGGLDTKTRFSGFLEDNDGINSIGSNKNGKVIMFYRDRWWKWYRNGSAEIEGAVIDKYIDIDTDHSPEKKKEIVIAPVFMSQDIDDANENSGLTEIHYPSEKEAKVYGAILQLDYGPNPKFARLRGNEVYYFTKLSDKIQFTGRVMNVSESKEKFPPDVSAVFRGPDQTYYFIREEQYCRRPLDVSALNLEPPDYCPEGGDLLELFGCTRHQYISAIDRLCQNPRIDNAISTSDGKFVYVFHNEVYWILSGLPNNIRHEPTNSYITYGGNQTETWLNSDINYDAFFGLQSDSLIEKVVEFHRSRYRVWSAIGGLPEEEGDIVENETAVNNTKAIPFISAIKKPAPIVKENRKIVYSDKWHIKLCAEPTIDSADSNLNGSEVYLFKGDRYYILTGLREGVGKLGVTALTSNWLPEFDPSGTSFVTCKEGYRRSNLYQWMPKRKWTAWDRTYKLWGNRQNWDQQAINGFSATLHNRNASEPLMIGLDGELVHYYSTADWWFSYRTRVMHYNDTREQFPPGIEAAFSMPDGYVYLFRGNKFCVRQWIHVPPPLYCPLWQDSRVLFGCFGPYKDIRKSITTARVPSIDREALYDLCHDLNIDDADRLWQKDDELYVWRGTRYWHVIGFPKAPRVVAAGPGLRKWSQFSENPDAVVMIQEGTIRRGCIVAFYGGYWSAWYPSDKPWVGSKAWWAQPNPSLKFGAAMHNGDIDNPQVLGFDGNYVHYYNTEGSNLYFKEKLKLSETSEVWPENITAAWRMEDNTVYLFRGDRYCKRNWNCNDSSTNCCYQWIDARFLFGCEAKLKGR